MIRRVETACNKVPARVRDGSIQVTRAWMEARQRALKLTRKPGVTKSELISAIASLE